MQLHVSPICASYFTVSKSVKMMATEISDLRGHNLLQQLYDDACDVGIAVSNPVTLVTTRWCWEFDSMDNENDLIAKIYVPTPETLNKHPHLRGWKIHLLND